MTTLPKQLSRLSSKQLFEPTLIIDKVALEHNLALVNRCIPNTFNKRLVVKSLPSLPLLEHTSKTLGTQKFMCFHVPFIKQIVTHFPDADILLGKPLPTAAFEHLCHWLIAHARADLAQIQWLVDTPKRLESYLEVCSRLDINVRFNFEINIGLQRGGFSNDKAYLDALNAVKNSPYCTFSGLMGYEAHAAKIPKALGGHREALTNSQREYILFKTIALQVHDDHELCFNTGGSTTFTEYRDTGPANELAFGSALLKPTDFDLSTLTEFKPALFIATPVLKRTDEIRLPGPKAISALLARSGLTPSQAIYIYGGNWLAKPYFPAGMKHNSLFGRSSNQELYSVPITTDIAVDDLVFFRPTQSEALALQFGDIAVVTPQGISEWWPPLRASDTAPPNKHVREL